MSHLPGHFVQTIADRLRADVVSFKRGSLLRLLLLAYLSPLAARAPTRSHYRIYRSTRGRHL